MEAMQSSSSHTIADGQTVPLSINIEKDEGPRAFVSWRAIRGARCAGVRLTPKLTLTHSLTTMEGLQAASNATDSPSPKPSPSPSLTSSLTLSLGSSRSRSGSRNRNCNGTGGNFAPQGLCVATTKTTTIPKTTATTIPKPARPSSAFSMEASAEPVDASPEITAEELVRDAVVRWHADFLDAWVRRADFPSTALPTLTLVGDVGDMSAPHDVVQFAETLLKQSGFDAVQILEHRGRINTISVTRNRSALPHLVKAYAIDVYVEIQKTVLPGCGDHVIHCLTSIRRLPM